MKRPAANDVVKRPAAMKAKKAKTATKDNRDAANDVVGVSDASEGEAEVGAISDEDKGDRRDRLKALAVQRKICTSHKMCRMSGFALWRCQAALVNAIFRPSS